MKLYGDIFMNLSTMCNGFTLVEVILFAQTKPSKNYFKIAMSKKRFSPEIMSSRGSLDTDHTWALLVAYP